jgi:hypothetical protein
MSGLVRKLGKDWLATFWPGYCGVWLFGRNNDYQPSFGVLKPALTYRA